MTHDRMKMKAEQVQLFYGILGVFDGARALQRIDGRPSLSNYARIVIAHLGDVFIRTGRRARYGFDIEGHQHRLDSGLLKLRNDLGFCFRRPSSIPIFSECFDVRPLRFDPRLRVGIAMKVDHSHALQTLIRRRSVLSIPSPVRCFYSSTKNLASARESLAADLKPVAT